MTDGMTNRRADRSQFIGPTSKVSEPKMLQITKNKTKYTMDPGMYYLLEADEGNTNRY